MDLLDELYTSCLQDRVYDDVYDSGGQPFVDYCVRKGLGSDCDRIGNIWFHGGPPTSQGWVAGPVSQFAADRILRVADKVGKRVVARVMRSHLSRGAP